MKLTPRDTKRDVDFTNAFALAAIGMAATLVITLFATIPIDHRSSEPVLPRLANVKAVEATGREAVINIFADGRMTLGQLYVTEHDLRLELAAMRGRTPDRRILVAGDRKAPFRLVQIAVAEARRAGFSDVVLLSGPRDALDEIQHPSQSPPRMPPN